MSQDTPLVIQGGYALSGEFAVQPSKNAALPVIIASLLSREPVTLHGVPRLRDIRTLLTILAHLGTRATWVGPHSLTLHTPELVSVSTPHDLVAQLRASISLMGTLVARAGEAHVGAPGGCTFSERPVDQHVKALRGMGLEVTESGGVFHVARPRPVSGTHRFDLLTVGGTQNAILAAVLGEGEVTLQNCSIDTDVVELVHFLNSLGADIRGAGTGTLTVLGVPALRGGEYHIIPDRLEAGTMMIAAAATRSCLTLSNVRPDHLSAVTAVLRGMGVAVNPLQPSTLVVDARHGTLTPVSVEASPFPGFPTDLQPIMTTLLATVPGTSSITDRIYRRVTHVPELRRMGARIDLDGNTQHVHGTVLHGATVEGADIRSGAALVVAGLAAVGETVVGGVRYIERGYERFAERLRGVGADIRHVLPDTVDTTAPVQLQRVEATLPAAMD